MNGFFNTSATDVSVEVRLAFAEGRVRGMTDALHMLYPKGIQNTDAIEELVRILKNEKEGSTKTYED